LVDRWFDFTLLSVLAPFTAPYRPAFVSLGIIAGYLSLLLTWSFYVRTRVGQKTWRMFHYAGFLAFTMATAHGVFAGSDTGSPWAIAMYTGFGGAVLFLTFARILGGRYVPARAGKLAAPHARAAGPRPSETATGSR
jgi:hypothetical protein